MSRESISTPSAPKPAGSYSQAIRANGFIFISGQTPRRSDGSRLSGAPFDEQALLAIENLEAIARAAGGSLRDAVKVDVFLKNLSDRAAFDMIYANYLGAPYPARTLTQSNFIDFDVR